MWILILSGYGRGLMPPFLFLCAQNSRWHGKLNPISETDRVLAPMRVEIWKRDIRLSCFESKRKRRQEIEIPLLIKPGINIFYFRPVTPALEVWGGQSPIRT